MKNIVRYVVLGVLFVAIVVLIVMLIFKNNNQELVKYKFYDDDLIEIDNQTSMEVQANIVSSNSLGVLLSSDSDNYMQVKIEVNYYDDNQENVFTDTNEFTVFDHGKQISMFLLPDLFEKYAGTIDIKVTGESVENGLISSSQIEMTETHSVDEASSTNFNIQTTNNSDVNISMLLGNVILLKNNKIVGYYTFSINDLMANSTVSSAARFDAILTESQPSPVDFDEVLVIPSYIVDNTEG